MATLSYDEVAIGTDSALAIRERQIEEIRKDLLVVRDLFIQMEGLVERQGPDIISIEQNITNGEQNMAAANENLQAVYDKKWRCTIL